MSSRFLLQFHPARLRATALRIDRSSDGSYSVEGPSFRLSGCHQAVVPETIGEEHPIVTRRLVLAYVGRVDNRSEIARLLGLPELATAPDGTVLAAAWERWGAQLSRYVIGAFAWVAYDRLTGEISALEDSLGVAALLRYETSQGLFLASDIDTMLAGAEPSPPLDRSCLAEYLATGGGLSTDRTLYEGVVRLPPSCAILADPRQIRVVPCWQADLSRDLTLPSDAAYAEAVRDMLEQAVRASLRAVGPVACDVSGGLDSSTVTALAARLAREGAGPVGGLWAFRIVHTKSPECDESVFQDAVLAQHPLPQIIIDGDACTVIGDLLPTTEPPWELLQNRRAAAASRALGDAGVQTRLLGVGGDELFCCPGFPPVYLAEWLRAGRLADWARDVYAHTARNHSVWALLTGYSRGRIPILRSAPGEPDLPPWLQGDALAVAQRASERLLTVPGSMMAHAARAHQLQALQASARMLRYLHHPGCDMRFPLLHRPLVELLLSIPWEQKLTPSSERVVMRAAMEGLLPDSVRLRRSKGDFTPIFMKTLRDSTERLLDLSSGQELGQLGLIDPALFQLAAHRMIVGGVGGMGLRFMYGALTLEGWLRAVRSSGLASAAGHPLAVV